MPLAKRRQQMNDELNKPNVFDYEDVGTFLKDWLNYLRTIDKNFSIRKLTVSTQLSTGYLSMLQSAQRSITKSVLDKLLPHLKLNQKEIRFIELLHVVGTSENQNERLDALSEISKLSLYKKNNGKEVSTYKYLTKWHYVAIREMTQLPDFKLEASWIQKRLRCKVSLKDIEDAINFLLTNNYIIKKSDNSCALPTLDLQCKEGIYKASLAEFHRQVLNMAHASIQEVPREQRYILGRTVTINSNDFEKAKEIFDNALKMLEQFSTNKDQSIEYNVYHFELAAFPMTHKKEGDL